MENINATEGQAPASVTEESQPSQESQTQVDGETQERTEGSETVSRLEYNKAKEAERKLRSEIARLSRTLESSKPGIDFYQALSKSDPAKFQKLVAMLQQEEKQQEPQEDESWLDQLDPRVAKRFRDEAKIKRDLMSRLGTLEQKLNSTENWTVGQNERALDTTFTNFLEQEKIFPEVTEEIEASPKFKMIKNHVLSELSARCGGNPKLASVNDLQEVLSELKMGLTEIGKQELTSKVQPVVPLSGSKSGQIPKSDKITNEDVTNFWSGVRQGFGWS